MARTPDPSRKPELLVSIIDYLRDRTLNEISFRDLAVALDVSTYELVFHFHSRAELIRDIVEAVSARRSVVARNISIAATSVDGYIASIDRVWYWMADPQNRHLLRLGLEAAALESLKPGDDSSTRVLFVSWVELISRGLEELGLIPDDAAQEAHNLMAAAHGVQFDLIVNNDEERTRVTFTHLLDHHRARIDALIAQR